VSAVDRRRRVAFVLGFALLVFAFTTGCDDTQAVSDYLDSWLGTQSSTSQLSNEAARTGDDGVNGILDAAETVNEIQEADDIYARARPLIFAGDPQAGPLLDQCIALRPDDMRYRRDRARAALWQDDAVIARQQWEEQDRIASGQGVDESFWYWEGCFRSAIQVELDFITYHSDPLSYSPQEDRAAVAIYTRAADCLERLAAMNTSVGSIELANRQMQQAEEYRQKAQAHGG
jgi:hypothetical protein